jgi:hypothetical protein
MTSPVARRAASPERLNDGRSSAGCTGASAETGISGRSIARSRARRTRKSAPRHSGSSGSTYSGPATSAACATSAVASRASASAETSSAWALSKPFGGVMPSASSALAWSTYCRPGSSSRVASSDHSAGDCAIRSSLASATPRRFQRSVTAEV